MKKTKVIIPALGILLLSTAASVTGTVAWFSMNTTVTATGMNVQAKAQAGLVISNATNGTYNANAASAKTTCAALYPASTYNLSTWLTSVSTNPNQPNTQQAYSSAVAWTTNESDAHYVLHDFYIRSSSATALTVWSVDVESVSADLIDEDTTDDETPVLQDLSKALRVGVKFGESSNSYIYAPFTGYTATVSVQKAAGAYSSAAADRQDVSALSGNTHSRDSSVTTIPANNATGLHAYVYVWFEGEDANCISDNIVSDLNKIAITVSFTTTATNPNA